MRILKPHSSNSRNEERRDANGSSAEVNSQARKRKLSKTTDVDKEKNDKEPGNNLIPSSSTSPQNDRFCPEVILRETTGTQTDVIPRTTTGTQTEDCSPEPEPKLSNGEVSTVRDGFLAFSSILMSYKCWKKNLTPAPLSFLPARVVVCWVSPSFF
ncbi:hypothetical protein CAEBREN_00317 [Caenorhabditis brenneri]|uniref:Uncharacterized protein n=1 Tax=Caenorhabditis brenneri TaxID=135651 RepID=G0N1N0_CAEBE|nr:hypothetical protein CAEBREN_00317 [Caenorhabditis brenneri]